MLKFLSSVVFLLSVSGIQLAIAQQFCEVKPGDTIIFSDADSIYQKLSSASVRKDEFETSGAYDQRISTLLQTVGIESQIVLEGNYSPKTVHYDADKQELRLNETAWNLVHIQKPDDVEIKLPSKPRQYDWNTSYHGLALKGGESEVIGSYEGQNAFGAKVEVVQKRRVSYRVADRPILTKWDGQITIEPLWKFDGYQTNKSEYSFVDDVPYISLSLSPQVAKFLKETMRVAFVVEPKFPFYYNYDKFHPAKIDFPIESQTTEEVLVADIKCAILTDKDGRAIRVIDTGYWLNPRSANIEREESKSHRWQSGHSSH